MIALTEPTKAVILLGLLLVVFLLWLAFGREGE